MTDESGAIWTDSPNFWPGRSGHQPAYVIVHGTAGGSSAQGIAGWFANPASQVSSHYVIGTDGQVVQCVNESDSAWGNGIVTGTPGIATPDSGNDIRDSWWSEALNPNLITISIEHCKPDQENQTPLTDAQKQASFTLISHICDRHSIPKRAADAAGGITGHYSIDAINRTHCPGAYPWADLWTYLGQGDDMVPIGWKDDGTTLTAPNGLQVVLGFRDFILTHPWSPSNFPIELEHEQSPLEISNTALGKGTQQLFRLSMLGYTPALGVFEEYLGVELLALRAQMASIPNLAALKALIASQQQALAQIGQIAKQFEAS